MGVLWLMLAFVTYALALRFATDSRDARDWMPREWAGAPRDNDAGTIDDSQPAAAEQPAQPVLVLTRAGSPRQPRQHRNSSGVPNVDGTDPAGRLLVSTGTTTAG